MTYSDPPKHTVGMVYGSAGGLFLVILRGSAWGAIEDMRDELWGEGLFQIGILYSSCFIANAFEIESEASWPKSVRYLL